MAEEIKVIRVGNILTNLIDPVTKLSVQYSKVLNWYDGTPMTDAKLDSYGIYVKKGSEYFLKSLGEYGQVLQKNTMTEMRNLSGLEILLLRMGYYNSVQLNGYYEKGDTPAPINYVISTTTEEDDGGSVIEVGSIKLEHKFVEIIDIKYFGAKDGEYIDDNLDNAIKYTGLTTLLFSKNEIGYRVSRSINVSFNMVSEDCIVIFDSKRINYFNIVANNVSISGFIVKCTHSATPTFELVPSFIYSFGKFDNIRIYDNDIQNMMIQIRGNAPMFESSENVSIYNNNIDCDFTGFPIFAIQNDIITVFNAHNINIYNNNIVGKKTNRVFKVASTSEDGYKILTKNINIYDNNIDIVGNVEEDNYSKQLIDLYHNTFDINFYNNKIKSRGYIQIFEHKTPFASDYDRFTKIYNNYFDVDSCYVYREVGSNGNLDISDPSKQSTQIYNNVFKISANNNGHYIFQTIGLHFLDIYSNKFVSEGNYSLLNISNANTLNFYNNDLTNFRLSYRFQFININEHEYEPVYGKIDIFKNRFSFNIDRTDGTVGCIELRAGTILIDKISITDNTFDYDIDLPNMRPIFMGVNVTLLNGIIINNICNRATTPLISLGNSLEANFIDDNNTWASINGYRDFQRLRYDSTFSSITPRRGLFLIEFANIPSNKTFVFNKTIYNNIGSYYILKNISNSTITLNMPDDSGISDVTLSPGDYLDIMAYSNNKYTIGHKHVQVAVSSDTAPVPSVEYSQAEVQAILNELRDLKTKMRTAGLLST